MNEMKFMSHRDVKAEAIINRKSTELPEHNRLHRDVPYDKVLNSMRNQERLFYSTSLRSGF